MDRFLERIHFASAPVSWGIQDDPGPAWEQPYERILEEIVSAGFTGAELGPYGYLPTDSAVLKKTLQAKGLKLLSSFVPVPITDSSKTASVVEHVRRVGSLLSAMGAELLVLSDCQTPERRRIAGGVPVDGSKSLGAAQWKQVGSVIAEVERVAAEYGLRLVFHPHVATFVETPLEVECLFEALAGSHVGLCLDTGHCVYGGGDPSEEASKYRSLLRYVHIKDVNARVLGEARGRKLDFEAAVGAGLFSQIGSGCIDFHGFFRFLAESRYSGWAVVEQDVIYGKTAVPPLESMRVSLNYLKNVISRIESSAGVTKQKG
ncbi:MAG: sugar phosphate isomerase/epimerase [Acidobacteriia bacterium]|nr:sugar phosphate isomerase/epimerase [Terriglobia bacterium]